MMAATCSGVNFALVPTGGIVAYSGLGSYPFIMIVTYNSMSSPVTTGLFFSGGKAPGRPSLFAWWQEAQLAVNKSAPLGAFATPVLEDSFSGCLYKNEGI